jgi:hypothetical protein
VISTPSIKIVPSAGSIIRNSASSNYSDRLALGTLAANRDGLTDDFPAPVRPQIPIFSPGC